MFYIHPYAPEHATALSELRVTSIGKLGAQAYSPAQLRAWLPTPETEADVRTRCEDGRAVFNAFEGTGKLVGSVDLETDGHIDFLYVHPDVARRGLALRLISHVESIARDRGLARLYTEASELAQPAFAKAGFHTLTRQDFDLRGVAIHNYAMEKRLSLR